MVKSLKTLVLNADGMPLTVVSWKRAIRLVYEDRVHQIDFYANIKIHDGKGRAYPVPAVVMKREYIRRNYTYAPFSKKNIFIRDQLCCQYCGWKYEPRHLTLDHVIPKSRWDKVRGLSTCWENIVACCQSCNKKKDNKTCEESGMFPINMPVRPAYADMFLGMNPWHDRVPHEWMPYLKNLPLFKGALECIKN